MPDGSKRGSESTTALRGVLSCISGDTRYLANTQGAQPARREWPAAEFFTQIASSNHSVDIPLTLLLSSVVIGPYFATGPEYFVARCHHGRSEERRVGKV